MRIKEGGGRPLQKQSCPVIITIEGPQSLYGVKTVYTGTGVWGFKGQKRELSGRKFYL